MTTNNPPLHNQLLSALSSPELNRISPYLELIELKLGEILYESGEYLGEVYFPISSVISVIYRDAIVKGQ